MQSISYLIFILAVVGIVYIDWEEVGDFILKYKKLSMEKEKMKRSEEDPKPEKKYKK